jgi:MYXO-CTERM domain-containing protein
VGYFCDNGECREKRADGQACELGSECANGFCIEGICCDTRCDGLCQSCRASEKADGMEDGTCGPAAEGTDPHDDCTADDPASCDKDGSCDGSGQCRLYSAGTECRDTACTGDEQNGFEVTAYECDGAGACDSSRQSVCGFYACADARCGSDCDDDAGCTLDAYCDGGECNSKTGLGTPCTLTSECQSGFCVDGVCCDGLCAGQCEACDLAGGEGRCTPVTGEPRGDRPACPEAPADEPCAQTECDGETRGECAGFPTGNVICQPAECVDDESGSEARPASRCNGGGVCEEASFVTCAAYRCDSDVCGSECDSNENCSPGNRCTEGRCISGATCSADGLELIDDTGNAIPCRPYRCEGALCRDSCETTADCAPGFSCNPENQRCEEVAETATADDSGCGCRVAGSSDQGGRWAAWLLGAGLAFGARRRSRPTRASNRWREAGS